MSDLPPVLINLLSRLAFYTSVRDNEKICFSGEFMVSASIGMGSFWRFCYGEKGIELITHTNQLIDDANAVIRDVSFTIEQRAYIYRYLEDMKLAIGRLCRSYNRDNKIKSDLEVCQTRINSMLRDIDDPMRAKIMEIREQTSSSIHPSTSPSIPYTPIPTGSVVPKTPPTNQCICGSSPQMQQQHSEQPCRQNSEQMYRYTDQTHQNSYTDQTHQNSYTDQTHQNSYQQIQEGTKQVQGEIKQIGIDHTYLHYNVPKSPPINIPPQNK